MRVKLRNSRRCEERFLRRSNPGFDFIGFQSQNLDCFVAKSAPRNDDYFRTTFFWKLQFKMLFE